MNSLFNYLKLILVFIFISPVLNASETEVTWAGVAFVSDKDTNKLYPYLSEQGFDNLNEWALKALQQNSQMKNFKNFKIRVNDAGFPLEVDPKQAEGILMSVVFFADDTFFSKNISVKGNVTYDNTYQIYGSLLFFEFGNGAYINSIPLIQQKVVEEFRVPDNKKILNNFSQMLRPSASNNYFIELFKQAQNIKLNELPNKFVKFGEVKFGPSVESFFAKSNESDIWKFRISKQYENELIKYSKFPLVPSGPNNEINQLRAVFEDASYEIILPEPTFVFNTKVSVFKKIDRPNKKKITKTICHIVGLRLKFFDKSFGEAEEELSVPFVRGKKSCGVIGINNEVDDQYFFPMNLITLIQNSSKQFRSIDNSYLKEATQGKEANAIKQIKKVQELMEF
ncbi:hypothetical protein N9O69_05165 [Alphaproteobacteria bacterium]|nr:hypothetical protein [Alphaproteobacteria bacterium]